MSLTDGRMAGRRKDMGNSALLSCIPAQAPTMPRSMLFKTKGPTAPSAGSDGASDGPKRSPTAQQGGYVKARMWKRELDFTGGILVDCLEIQKLEPVPPLMNSRLLMSSW